MDNGKELSFVEDVLNNMPPEWLTKTTHRLDIYNESKAKVQFTEQFEALFNKNDTSTLALNELPTAYDYIRLGHPLSCILEWVISRNNNLNSENVISFSSKTIAIMAILRKNLLDNKNTQILHTDVLPEGFNIEVLKNIYGYKFNLVQVDHPSKALNFDGTTIFISKQANLNNISLNQNIDFYFNIHLNLGSTILVNGEKNSSYISAIQHVRRRETIAMTPVNCVSALKFLMDGSLPENKSRNASKGRVLEAIKGITGANTKALLGSSGLSVQYAIVMGLVHEALEVYKGKEIKIIVPPNCYGGTNDQARRVAACFKNVEVVDLAVDSGKNMVESTEQALAEVARQDAVPYIIAEIPTNPRVEVPDLLKLKEVLSKKRNTKSGAVAVDPVFILDQTFCPNVHFLGEGDILSAVRTISYVSGSKFPSGGRCTSGYCVANKKAKSLIDKIETHLKICDNEATGFQVDILSEQLPSMNQRISDAYRNTREFVNYIKETLPEAKINFVSEDLASQSFTPSVFSLDLPTKGNSAAEKETYKRKLNYKLINLMITEIPDESKHCVSYGQLKGCYWTIPATSTQGTTKEGDKDYIVRVSMSPEMDIQLHKKVFLDFVQSI